MGNKQSIFMPCSDSEMNMITSTLAKYGIKIKYDNSTKRANDTFKSLYTLCSRSHITINFQKQETFDDVFCNYDKSEREMFSKFNKFDYNQLFNSLGIELDQEDIKKINTPYQKYDDLSILDDIELPKHFDEFSSTYVKLLQIRSLWWERDGYNSDTATEPYGLYLCRSSIKETDNTISVLPMGSVDFEKAQSMNLFCFQNRDTANLFVDTFKPEIDKIKSNLPTFYNQLNIDGVGSITLF